MLGNSGRFRTLGLVQCKQNRFRELQGLISETCCFVYSHCHTLSETSRARASQLSCFNSSPVASTSATGRILCERDPPISSLRKVHITGSFCTCNPLQIVKKTRCVKADTAFKQILKKKKKFMPWIQIKVNRVITGFVVRTAG